MSVHHRRFIDSIYYTGELTTSDKGSKVQGCVVLIATNNSMNANIVSTEPAILINIRKLHQPALTELRRSQHQIIYQTKMMIWWTHMETTDMAARVICKSYEQEWFLSGNSSQPAILPTVFSYLLGVFGHSVFHNSFYYFHWIFSSQNYLF